MQVPDTMFGVIRSARTCSMASLQPLSGDQLGPAHMVSWIRRRDICLGSICFLLAFILAGSPVIAAEPKRVMLLHSFGPDFMPWSDYARAIRAELHRQTSWPLDVTEHALIAARFSGDDPDAPFVEYLGALYTKQRLDLIISIGAPAANFVQRHRQKFFPTTPMLLAVVDQRRVQFSILTPNDVAVAVSIDYFAAIDNIMKVLPGTKNIAVVVGSSPIEKYWREEIARSVKPFADRIAFTWYDHLSFEDILKHAAALPPSSVIFWELMIRDAKGIIHEEGKALTRLHAVANAPIFSYTDAFFGRGIVGGPHVPVSAHGQQVAEVAFRILGGEKAGAIKAPPLGFATPKFDWREMQRWGISGSHLPPESEVHFRELTAWERYRWQITSAIMAFLLQSAMISWLLIERHRRREAEIETRRRLREVMHLSRTAEIGALSASFAHELSQPLLSVALNTERMEKVIKSDAPESGKLKEILGDIRQANSHAGDIIQHLGKMFRRRREHDVQECDVNAPIADALHILSPEANRRHIAMRAEGVQRPLPVRIDPVHLQQVIVNLVTNGMDAMADTPGHARGITIRTALVEGSSVEVSISDTGTGIPEEKLSDIFDTFYTSKEQGTGLGLSVARTIIETYGGKIWAENQAGGGAVFRFTLPIIR